MDEDIRADGRVVIAASHPAVSTFLLIQIVDPSHWNPISCGSEGSVLTLRLLGSALPTSLWCASDSGQRIPSAVILCELVLFILSASALPPSLPPTLPPSPLHPPITNTGSCCRRVEQTVHGRRKAPRRSTVKLFQTDSWPQLGGTRNICWVWCDVGFNSLVMSHAAWWMTLKWQSLSNFWKYPHLTGPVRRGGLKI